MKLELDTHSSNSSSLDNSSNNSNSVDSKADEVKNMLRSGINLAKEGNRPDARQTLLKVTEADPDNETAWLWLASISEYPEELLVFLQNVLKINPENERALKWAQQTKTLLSKTFVQRGINAVRDNQRDFGRQCFLQGIVHDGENEMAWLWLASISDVQEEKLAHLQKVLQINPNNETALASLNALKGQNSQNLLRKANSAAISGDHKTAEELLETIMKDSPELEEAWILKAYLAKEYYEKIECYQKVLELNPKNEAAQAGLASLQALAAKAVKVDLPDVVSEELSVVENEEFSAESLHEELQQFEDYPSSEEVHQSFDGLIHDTIDSEMVQTVKRFEESKENAFAENGYAVENPVEETSLIQMEESLPEESVEVASQAETAAEEVKVFEEMEVQEEVSPEEENEATHSLEVSEQVDSPTQELDEEFIRTAEAAFSSFEQPEEVEQSAEEISSIHLTEEANTSEEEVSSIHLTEEANTSEEVEETVLARENFSEETEVIEEVEETNAVEESVVVEEPSFSHNNGFEMLAAKEPFADFQPSAELSYSNLKVSPTSFEESGESVEVKEESFIQEFATIEAHHSAPTQTLEYKTEMFENGFKEESFDYNEDEKVSSYEDVEDEIAQEVEAAPIQETVQTEVQLTQCPFCQFENEGQVVVCNSCQTVISFSDLELLLSHQAANQDILLSSIEKMEVEKGLREFSVAELTTLGIGHLNAKNLRKGFAYLKEASELDPNDVVLSSKVNFLAIRLSEIEEQDSKSSDTEAKQCTIMVVDDSPTVRKLISGKLEKCGHTVVPAVDGMDALAKINEVIPDLILLDITMPRLDGYQVCKLIRNNEITKDIPIVMISGKDGFFDKVRGRMAGSSGYITKPFGPDTLMKTIESYLN